MMEGGKNSRIQDEGTKNREFKFENLFSANQHRVIKHIKEITQIAKKVNKSTPFKSILID